MRTRNIPLNVKAYRKYMSIMPSDPALWLMLELPLSRMYYHGSKGVRAIEVLGWLVLGLTAL